MAEFRVCFRFWFLHDALSFPLLPISIKSDDPLRAGSAGTGPVGPFTLGCGRLGPGGRTSSFSLLGIVCQLVADTRPPLPNPPHPVARTRHGTLRSVGEEQSWPHPAQPPTLSPSMLATLAATPRLDDSIRFMFLSFAHLNLGENCNYRTRNNALRYYRLQTSTVLK